MAKGEIILNEELCKGCGYCVHFCKKDCLSITGDKVTSTGYRIPTVVSPEKCTGCGICGWLCPDFAIEVYIEGAA